MLPSEVLLHSQLSPEDFGVADDMVDDGLGGVIPRVDMPGNVVYATVAAAQVAFDVILPSPSNQARADLAFVYFSLFRLYGVLADDAAMNVGLVTQRGGQVNTPLGSHEELMRAALRNLGEARSLYPDALWPVLDDQPSGGSIKVPRSYVP